MAEIQILPTHLVNRIAAGEVIERPASVVKELVENALDAGAGRIDIALADGGKKLIAVTDDGAGMSRQGLSLAFAPHATSKIASEQDLFQIETMGFRGEALASIAAVSRAHIRSRQDDSGYEVEAAGGQIAQVRPVAAAAGTTVTVRDLFFNTPARRKFLRTTNTELGHISEQLTRLSLPYPRVAFTLTHNGREIQNLPPAESTTQRAADLFGQDLADCLLPIVPRGDKVAIAGLIAPPSAGRSAAKWQYFFLNGRYIRDRLLGHALREAYRGLIDPQKWPVAMVFIDLAPAEVDVNVHPTKIEVRFHDSRLVHGELLAALRETLNRANLTPQAELAGDHRPDLAPSPEGDQARADSLREALADFFKSSPPPQPRLSFPESRRQARPAGGPGRTPGPVPVTPAGPPAGDLPAAATAPSAGVMQLHSSYILAASEDGLLIIDQHALHERIIYNELKAKLAAGRLVGQRLLIPETIQVTPGEVQIAARCEQLLRRLGIELDAFGPNVLAVQQFPALLAERSVRPGPFIQELLDKLGEDETTDAERLLEGVLEMLACRAAVKAGQPLTSEEIDALLAGRRDAEKGSACPHGRPTTIKLTLKDLEKQFRRA